MGRMQNLLTAISEQLRSCPNQAIRMPSSAIHGGSALADWKFVAQDPRMKPHVLSEREEAMPSAAHPLDPA